MDHAPLLARSDLFSALDAGVVGRIAASASSLDLQRNQLVFSEGQPAEELYVVRSGRIA